MADGFRSSGRGHGQFVFPLAEVLVWPVAPSEEIDPTGAHVRSASVVEHFLKFATTGGNGSRGAASTSKLLGLFLTC